MIGGPAEIDLLADHSVLLAIPALLPAVALVAVIVAVAVRDRRAEARDTGEPNIDSAGEENAPNTGRLPSTGHRPDIRNETNADAAHGDSAHEREENR